MSSERHQPMEALKTEVAVLTEQIAQISEAQKKHEMDDKEQFGRLYKKLEKIEAKLNMGIGAILALEFLMKAFGK